jgi:hypothetical protein
MKKLLSLGLMVMVITVIPSCKKDNLETDIEKIEKELSAFVSENGITKCTIIFNWEGPEQITVAQNMDFSISGGFVIVRQSSGGFTNEDRYNLLYLSWYSLSTNSTNKELILYFE